MGMASGSYIHLLIPILFKQPPHDLVVECRRLKDSKKIGNVMKSMKFIPFEIEYLESAHIALGYSKEIAESSRHTLHEISRQRKQPKLKNNFTSTSYLTTVVKKSVRLL
ncbi:hypothetical protein TNCT_514341 [Trichonephila clavata]|uniref:Uncharacterized protein n=1 Tax=Trichonephila clavata TaxID=2740835 RepID=A0A8X6FUK5_TRICU|nr:hypothetical protein TNCT_514341 [Trichonephila clavata]